MSILTLLLALGSRWRAGGGRGRRGAYVLRGGGRGGAGLQGRGRRRGRHHLGLVFGGGGRGGAKVHAGNQSDKESVHD